MAVRAVVWDVGGVLYEWHPRFLYDKLIADAGERRRFLSRILTIDWHFQHDHGRDFADTSAELIAEHPDYGDLIRAFRDRFNETIRGPVEGTHALLHELDARGVPLFAITNFSHEFFPKFRDAHRDVFDRFRDVVVSGDEKLAKPDPEIYRRALARFGLAPGEGLFIDDNEQNVEAARANGFVAHHFTTAERLRAELVAHALLPA